MQKFKSVGLVGLGLILGVMGFWVISNNKSNETYEDISIKENSKLLSMMLETEAGSGKYQETTASSWPTDGYVFNSNLSKCKNGSNLSWDNDKKQVIFDGNTKDDCYIYFDVYIPPRYDEICDESLFACYVAKQYTGTQGDNNMYYHDSTLTNGAGDNSYRFAGSSETTNNFVCFGYDSTDGTCPTDYLYRIIGVFDNQVKLIKYDYAKSTLLGTDGDYYNTYSGAGWSSSSYGITKGSNAKTEIGVYRWNYLNAGSSKNIWSESRLNTTNLNTNFLNNIGTSWSNKIATHTWEVGGNEYANIASLTVPNAYKNEITSPANETTYDAKIGLMYVSDYGYAAAPSAWTTKLSSYNGLSVRNVNWMYMGLYEWPMTCRSDGSYNAFFIYYDGRVYYSNVSEGNAIRLTFYLNSNVSYVSGDGSMETPYIIS